MAMAFPILDSAELDANAREALEAILPVLAANPERLDTSGVGEAEPIASNDTNVGQAQNRRVELAMP